MSERPFLANHKMLAEAVGLGLIALTVVGCNDKPQHPSTATATASAPTTATPERTAPAELSQSEFNARFDQLFEEIKKFSRNPIPRGEPGAVALYTNNPDGTSFSILLAKGLRPPQSLPLAQIPTIDKLRGILVDDPSARTVMIAARETPNPQTKTIRAFVILASSNGSQSKDYFLEGQPQVTGTRRAEIIREVTTFLSSITPLEQSQPTPAPRT